MTLNGASIEVRNTFEDGQMRLALKSVARKDARRHFYNQGDKRRKDRGRIGEMIPGLLKVLRRHVYFSGQNLTESIV